jgi:hypothetical protein
VKIARKRSLRAPSGSSPARSQCARANSFSRPSLGHVEEDARVACLEAGEWQVGEESECLSRPVRQVAVADFEAAADVE